jgi:signal transduction histidine kinase
VRGRGRLRRHLGLAAEIAGYLFWLAVDLGVSLDTGAWLNVVAGTAVPVVVLLRRRSAARLGRVTAAALGLSGALTVVSMLLTAPDGVVFHTDMAFAEQLALAILIIAALRHLALRPALLAALLGAVAVVGSAVLRSTGDDGAIFGTMSALGWGGAVAIGLVLRDSDTRRRASLDEVRSAERKELARELHDVVAHHVTGIIVAAQAAAVVARTSPDDVDRALAAIEHAGGDAMAAMRRMVGVLRGQADGEAARTPGAELGGVPGLIRGFDPQARLVRLSGDPHLQHAVLPAGVAATGYRVVQEALTNVRRHAPDAARVEVDLRIHARALHVTVRNDGVPPTGSRTPGGFGLVGMAERVAALDGTLTAGPTEPGVWTVAARLPLGGAT